jgi:hypothetical protein
MVSSKLNQKASAKAGAAHGAFKIGYSQVIAIASTLGVSAASFVVCNYAWASWTLYAIAVTGFVLLGGIQYWPWKVKCLRPVGGGLLFGIVAAAAKFFIS